jgi:lauroyl/myristoyl acyltransferase
VTDVPAARPSLAEDRVTPAPVHPVFADRDPDRAIVRWVNRGLGWLPWPWGEDIMAALGVAQAVLRPARFRQALRWAAAQPGRRDPHRLAVSLLAHHGRFIAQDAHVGIRTADQLRAKLVAEGLEHLRQRPPGRGLILLGFHLGPVGTPRALRVLGYRVNAAISGRRHRTALPMTPGGGETIPLYGPSRQGDARALRRAVELLRAGEIVYITADGRVGTESFQIPLPGGPLVVRAGWLALRRLTGAATHPVLMHIEGPRRVITIHPALPPPAPVPDDDVAGCRAALTVLIEEYVRRFPEQCRSLALWYRRAGDSDERGAD